MLENWRLQCSPEDSAQRETHTHTHTHTNKPGKKNGGKKKDTAKTQIQRKDPESLQTTKHKQQQQQYTEISNLDKKKRRRKAASLT
jgi:hypothetical protein